MSDVTIRCPYCGTSLTGDSAYLGQEVGCPDCGKDFIASTGAGPSGGPGPVSAESRPASSGRPSSRDSVFTRTELAVIKSPMPRRQPVKSAGFSGDGGGGDPASPAKKTVPLASRKKRSFDQRFGLGTPRVFTLTSWFWTFFFIGVLVFSLGVFSIFDASGYDGSYRDWGSSAVSSDVKKKWDASVGETSYAAAKNTAALCEGVKCINRNIGNIGSHYQGLHEMFLGFTLIFGSGFFFFCALISFLYSAKLPAVPSEKEMGA